MKRIYSLLTLLVLAATPAMLTSCDPDEPWHDGPDNYWYNDYYGDWYDDYDWYGKPFDYGKSDLVSMAQTLNGAWTGTLTDEYTDDNGQRVQANMYVDFTFVQYDNKSNNGTGYEIDYVPSCDKNGNPVYDKNGNQIYDESETRKFEWYIDPRTYNIYIQYKSSNYRYLLDSHGNSETSGFSLGWNKQKQRDEFNGVMEGINTDEYIFFDCERVTANRIAARKAPSTTVHKKLSFGKADGFKRTKSNVPMALRKH